MTVWTITSEIDWFALPWFQRGWFKRAEAWDNNEAISTSWTKSTSSSTTWTEI